MPQWQSPRAVVHRRRSQLRHPNPLARGYGRASGAASLRLSEQAGDRPRDEGRRQYCATRPLAQFSGSSSTIRTRRPSSDCTSIEASRGRLTSCASRCSLVVPARLRWELTYELPATAGKGVSDLRQIEILITAIQRLRAPVGLCELQTSLIVECEARARPKPRTLSDKAYCITLGGDVLHSPP